MIVITIHVRPEEHAILDVARNRGDGAKLRISDHKVFRITIASENRPNLICHRWVRGT
jgi:hypothetical protein